VWVTTFLTAFFSDLETLAFRAGVHALHFDFHRVLASRFPYAIYYKILDGKAVVFRVLDCRRDPRKIASELISVI
jgi:plasmid stabilization system protein ParE